MEPEDKPTIIQLERLLRRPLRSGPVLVYIGDKRRLFLVNSSYDEAELIECDKGRLVQGLAFEFVQFFWIDSLEDPDCEPERFKIVRKGG
jgi:hypothetical protein